MAGDSFILIEEIPYLVEHLGDPRKYFTAFQRAGILSPSQLEATKSQPTIERTIEHFIRTVAKSDRSYNILCNELRRQKANVWIARHLSDCRKGIKGCY